MDFTTFTLLVLFGLACAYFLSRLLFGTKAKEKLPADSYFHHAEPAEIIGEMEEAIESFRAKREVKRQSAEKDLMNQDIKNHLKHTADVRYEGKLDENLRTGQPIPLKEIRRDPPRPARSVTPARPSTPPRPIRTRASRTPSWAGSKRRDDDSSFAIPVIDTGPIFTDSRCDAGSSSSDTSSSSCPTD